MNLADLRKPFPPEKISWRVGSTNGEKTKGLALAYIDSRDVQDRLDEVCGAENWQSRYPHANGKTVCEIGIKIGSEWIWKADGAGDTDVEAEKGALSDAFKRAAVRWGIGRYLYDLDSPWVKLEAAGRSYKIASEEYPRLRALLNGSKQPVPRATAEVPPASPAVEYTTVATDPDVEQGVRNFTAKMRAEIDACARIPELYQFKDQHEGELARLKAKHPSAHTSLKQYYQAKFEQLSKKETVIA